MRQIKPLFFGSFLHAGKNAQSSSSTTSAQPASQMEGIYTISHIPFGAMCRDSMSTQLWCHVLSHHSFRWRNLCLPFFLWNAGKNTQSSMSTTSAQPASQSEGIYTISHIPFGAMCRGCMSTQVCYHVLSHHRYRWRNLFLHFFSFWNAAKNAQLSSSTTSAQPASQSEGIYTISHIPFRAMCRDCMWTQVCYHVLSHYS